MKAFENIHKLFVCVCVCVCLCYQSTSPATILQAQRLISGLAALKFPGCRRFSVACRYLFHICRGNTTTFLRERLKPGFDAPCRVRRNKNKPRFPALAAGGPTKRRTRHPERLVGGGFETPRAEWRRSSAAASVAANEFCSRSIALCAGAHTRLHKCISEAKNSPSLTHYITKGMEAFGCLPPGPSVNLRRAKRCFSPSPIRPPLSLPAALFSTLSPPLLPPSPISPPLSPPSPPPSPPPPTPSSL